MKRQVFRSTPSFVFAWLWMAFAAANLVDLAVRGRDVTSVIAAGSLLLGAGVAYVIGLRPRVVADDAGLWLHNPLRDVRLPWSAVDKVETTDAIEVRSGDRTFRAYALQVSPRARARAKSRPRRDAMLPDHVAEHVKGRLPIDFAVEQLNDLATRNRGEEPAAPPSVSLSWFAIATLAVPAAVLAAAIPMAILG
ncbi:MAG TPA: PH domain-containing protein [Streptosporangiaceae bacterium]|nr:PH domain-containing protein [Streptosporangiaceae bacterium]